MRSALYRAAVREFRRVPVDIIIAARFHLIKHSGNYIAPHALRKMDGSGGGSFGGSIAMYARRRLAADAPFLLLSLSSPNT
jgi:hypothetical protein